VNRTKVVDSAAPEFIQLHLTEFDFTCPLELEGCEAVVISRGGEKNPSQIGKDEGSW
jgi:hypothetical protein